MNLIKKTKKDLILKKDWDNYKNLFSQKQTRFLLTKIINILNPNADFRETSKIERKLIENKKDMFIEGSLKICEISNNDTYQEADWKSFGEFLYYVFQTGVFYKNKKNGIENIFLEGDFIELNIKKKILFNNFCESVKILSKDHNTFIKRILWVVL